MKKFKLFGFLSTPRKILMFVTLISFGFGSLLSSCSNEELVTQNENLVNVESEAARLSNVDAELFRLKQKTRRFENFNVAQAQGYDTKSQSTDRRWDSISLNWRYSMTPSI
mgnify:CR=1 FL=1